MDTLGRIDYNVDKWRKNTRINSVAGAGRFENMLKPSGFGGEVNTTTSRELLEFSATTVTAAFEVEA